jgi:hypothetical protein
MCSACIIFLLEVVSIIFFCQNTTVPENIRDFMIYLTIKSIQKTSRLSKSKLELLGWLNH